MATAQDTLNALNELLRLLEPNKQRYSGLLGETGGTVKVSGRANTVWFREDGNASKLRQIKNFKVPNIADLPVVTGVDANNPGEEQVLDIDMDLLPSWFGRNYVPEHHMTHELGGVDDNGNRVDTDIVWVQKQQLLPLLLSPQSPADMTLYVKADYYNYGDQRNYWGGGDTKTFSGPFASGYGVYELVCINGLTNELVYVMGTQFPLAAPRTESLIPEVPLGCVAVGAVYLPNGVTSLTLENLADVRVLWRTLGGSVAGSPHRHTSDLDGGILCSGLSVTGDQYWKRASDTTTRGFFNSELGSLDLHGGLSVTGNVTVSGGSTSIYDTYVSLNEDSRLRIPRGVDVTGWSGLEGEVAFDTGHKQFLGYNDSSWVSLDFSGRVVNTVRVTSAYVATVQDYMIFADTDGGAYSVTLPTGVKGQTFRITNVGTSGNDLTIDGDGAETVMGDATQPLSDGEIMILVYNDEEGWW